MTDSSSYPASDPIKQATANYNAHTGGSSSPITGVEDFFKGVAGGAESFGKGVASGAEGLGKNLYNLGKVLTVGEGGQKTVLGDVVDKPKKAPAKKKAAATTSSTTPSAAEQELEAEIGQGNLWNELGQQLVSQQKALDAPVEESISGALTAPAEKSSAAQALSSMGLAPNSSAAKWLSDQISQANTNDKPLTSAQNTLESEYAQGQSGISSALGAMGQANALDISTAPEADWVQSLVQHIMTNVNYYGEISPAQAAGLTPALETALANSGGGGGSATGAYGDIPITDTPAQYAQAVQNYYAHAGTPTTTNLPKTTTAATGALAGGTGGTVPGVDNTPG